MTPHATIARQGDLCATSVQAWEDVIYAAMGRKPLELGHQEITHTQPVGKQAFCGRIAYGNLAGISVCRMTVTPHRFRRTLRRDASHDTSPLILVVQVRNSSHFEQYGRSGVLSPSDWCLLDTRDSFKWTSLASSEQIIMNIQRPIDEDMSGLMARGIAERCDGKSGAGRVLHAMIGEGFGQMHRLATYSAMGIVNAITTTMWNALREHIESPAASQASDIQCSRIKAWIEARLSDADLSVDAIAQGCGMSIRSVHRAFHTDVAGSVSNYIWQRRVAQCATDLRSPTTSERSITDVALSWGFSSTSHFSRVFRANLGMSPRAFKASATHQVQ